MSTLSQEYSFSASDYKFMRFNVMAIPSGESILSSFPELNRFSSFQDIRKRFPYHEKIFKYICLCYDRKSPACTQISEMIKRKSWCALTAGFPYDEETGIFEKEYHDIINNEVEMINFAIIDFLLLFNNPDYMLLVSGQESFYRKLRQISAMVKDDKKNDLVLEKERGDLHKQATLLAKENRELEDKILNDNNTFLVGSLYRVINEELIQSLNLTPEKRAKMRNTK